MDESSTLTRSWSPSEPLLHQVPHEQVLVGSGPSAADVFVRIGQPWEGRGRASVDINADDTQLDNF